MIEVKGSKMGGNFNFLKGKKNFESFTNACLEAEKSILVSPAELVLSREPELSVRIVLILI